MRRGRREIPAFAVACIVDRYAPDSRLGHDGGIDVIVIGRRKGEQCTLEVAGGKFTFHENKAARPSKTRQTRCDPRRNDRNARSGLDQAARLSLGDRTAADHDDVRSIEVEGNRIAARSVRIVLHCGKRDSRSSVRAPGAGDS